ncbi:hypothetical protein [Lacticaseibacillus manihotivorans]|uniref:hypothetical protein n=1 Tax=Lacticaseibacillus manihotivorans TaxID=88233 RepID=UPI0006D2BB68|nr:hypothetical protein [Lacticaseibacillus manihotivorans]
MSTNPKTGKDYRKDTGNLITFNPTDAKAEWAKAQQELGKSSLTLTLLTADTEDAKNAGEFLQGQIESHLPGVHITLKSIPVAQRIAWSAQAIMTSRLGLGPQILTIRSTSWMCINRLVS